MISTLIGDVDRFASFLAENGFVDESKALFECHQIAGTGLELHLLLRQELRRILGEREIPSISRYHAERLEERLTEAIGPGTF